MLDVCFRENGPLPHILNQPYSHVHAICDRPIHGRDTRVDGDALVEIAERS